MNRVTVELDLPQTGKLTKAKRDEAQTLTELLDLLSLMKGSKQEGRNGYMSLSWILLSPLSTMPAEW